MEISSVNQAVTPQFSSLNQLPTSGNPVSSDFETFLKMLTTQLENQDPLDPVKSEDFAVQLATFSGVEQQVLTNDLLRSLTEQTGLSGMGKYASWVGMEARVASAASFNGSSITLAPEPELTAESAVLVVKNSNGTEVQRLGIPVSRETIEWTGQLDSGIANYGPYTFSVESYSNGAISETKPVEVYTQITEARIKNGEAVLVTEGGTEVAATTVTALREAN